MNGGGPGTYVSNGWLNLGTLEPLFKESVPWGALLAVLCPSACVAKSPRSVVVTEWPKRQREDGGDFVTNSSSTNKETLRSALKLAKNGTFEKALAMVERIDIDSLLTEGLRTMALIHSYCGREHEAEQIWGRICERSDVGIGDFYMLASTQMHLGQSRKAIANLRREIEISDSQGNAYCLGTSVISLAFLLSEEGHRGEAREVLSRVDDSESAYVFGVGQLTKRDLMAKL